MDLERHRPFPFHSLSHVQGNASMSRPCSLGMLTLLFLIYLFFYLFFLFPHLFGCLFLSNTQRTLAIRFQPLGSNGQNFWFAPLMDSTAYGKLTWSRGPGREERAERDFSRRSWYRVCSQAPDPAMPTCLSVPKPCFLLIPNRNDSRRSSPDSFQQGPQWAEAQA